VQVQATQSLTQTEDSKLWLPLRLKITLPYLILAILLAAGTSYIVTRIVFDSVEERFTNQLIESGKLSAEWIVSEENARLESIRLLTNVVGVSEALAAGNSHLLQELTFGITVSQHEDLVDYLTSQGVLALSMRRKPNAPSIEYQLVSGGGVEYLSYDFIRNVLLQQQVKPGERTAGLARLPWGDYFLIASPVYNMENRLSGVVLVGKSLLHLVQDLQQGYLTQVSIYDTNGALLISTLVDPDPLDSAKAALILQAQDDYSLRRDLTSHNIDYQEVLGPLEARYSEDLGIIGTSLPKTFLVRTSAITRANIMVLVFLSLFLIIIVGINLANYITEPLRQLVRASQRVAQGDLQVKVLVNSSDEIALLANSFNHMVVNLYRSKRDLIDAYDRTIEGWVKALELRDEETEGHSNRVVEMTLHLARKLNVPEAELENLKRGVLLHDIGKMVIPDEILLSPGPFTQEEREIMLKHPVYAYEMLGEISYLRPALDIPLYHHERWDGSGYPRGLKAHAIPFPARIFAVVDVFDAMSHPRRYRKPIQKVSVLEHLQQNSGILYDPQVVQAFLELHSQTGD
jgi:adenylate cyclase